MRGVLFFVVWLMGCAAALAEPCAGNPGALGTSRVLTVSPNDFRRIGSMGYEISYAYTNFDNATMYPLILLILLLSIAANSLLSHWERVLLARRGQK